MIDIKEYIELGREAVSRQFVETLNATGNLVLNSNVSNYVEQGSGNLTITYSGPSDLEFHGYLYLKRNPDFDVTFGSGVVLVEDVEGYRFGFEFENFYDAVAQMRTSAGIAFSSDGLRLVILSDFPDNGVFQYTLSTPFDISTAIYDDVFFSVAGQETIPKSIEFNTTGTRFYTLGQGGIDQYDMSTPFDISTATFNVNFAIGGQDTNHVDFKFNNDGSKLFTAGTTNDRVYEYTLSTPFDISTASYSGLSLLIEDQDIFPLGLDFNSTGTKMFIAGAENDSVYQYTLTTPFSISTASYDNVSFKLDNKNSIFRAPSRIRITPDDSKMIISGEFGYFAVHKLYQTAVAKVDTYGSSTVVEFNRVISN